MQMLWNMAQSGPGARSGLAATGAGDGPFRGLRARRPLCLADWQNNYSRPLIASAK